jgi:hypothetical protein
MALRAAHEYNVYFTLGDHTLEAFLYVWLMLLLATCLRFAYSCFRRLDDSAFLRYQEYYVQVTVPPIAVLLPPRFIYRTYVIYR